MPNLTDEQARAIVTRDVSVALSAGAGCGKTFVLTQRFLSHLDPLGDPVELSSLVAITFTDRAAREMRDRVRKTCRERLATCAGDQVEHWQKLVRELDGARISTIHSFCMSLLRAHAVEAGIDPDVRLFDETTGAAFLRESLTRSLEDLLTARDPDAITLYKQFGWDGTHNLLATLIPQRYRLNLSDWTGQSAESLAEKWRTCWERDVVPQLLREAVQSAGARRVISLLEEHVPTHDEMIRRRAVLLADLPALPGAHDPVAALGELIAAARVQGGGTKKHWSSEDVFESVKEALATLRGALEKLRERLVRDPADDLEAAAISLAALRGVERAGAAFDLRKRSEGWLDFDDLLILAGDLLRRHNSVRRRAAAAITLLMVDEFQDTDRLQAEIVRLLCGAGLTSGKLFLVGDIKQSIYRFRRAEPRVFRQLRQELPVPGRLPLTGNFRSQPAILHFVNALCDGALGDEYEALVPRIPQVTDGPCIEFLFATAEGDPPDESAMESDTAQKELADDLRRREANWIARRLRRLFDDQTPCVRERNAQGVDTARGVQPRDVAILFRAMSDIRFYEEALREQRIDHYVVGGRAFYAQQEIYDLVNLCRALDDPDDRVALVGLLRSPFFSISDEDLLEWFAGGGAEAAAPQEEVHSRSPVAAALEVSTLR